MGSAIHFLGARKLTTCFGDCHCSAGSALSKFG